MKNIKQHHHLQATIEEVYIALTNPLTIELWTGYPAVMSTEPSSEFSMFDGDIVGKNIDFIENTMICQQWYFDGQEEESVVTIRLKSEKNNTVAELVHSNVPDEIYEEMVEGWKKIYFGSLKRYFK